MQIKFTIKFHAHCFIHFFCESLRILNNFVIFLLRTIISYPITQSFGRKIFSNCSRFIHFFVTLIQKNIFQWPKSRVPKSTKIITMHQTCTLPTFANIFFWFLVKSPFLEQSPQFINISFMSANALLCLRVCAQTKVYNLAQTSTLHLHFSLHTK